MKVNIKKMKKVMRLVVSSGTSFVASGENNGVVDTVDVVVEGIVSKSQESKNWQLARELVATITKNWRASSSTSSLFFYFVFWVVELRFHPK